MSSLKLWVHVVWATKDRKALLESSIRLKVIDHIRAYAGSKNIFIDHINGHVDHIHCLISLGVDQNIGGVVHLLKGESSHWINKNKLMGTRFSWQNEYFATSVSHSQIDILRKYIRNQEQHHQKRTFQEEYQVFMKKYGFIEN